MSDKCELCEMRDKEVPGLVRKNRELSRRNEELEAETLLLLEHVQRLDKRINDFTGGAGRSASLILAEDQAEVAQQRHRQQRGLKTKRDWWKLFSK